MDLKNKNDQELLTDVKALREKEKLVVADLLKYLAEIDSRKLYLARGFSSLFVFCTDELGYSKDEAYIRIQAARLTLVLPEVEEQIRDGSLTLSAAAKVQSAFRKENQGRKKLGSEKLNLEEKREVIKAVQQQSQVQVERVLAGFFPEAPIEKTKPLSAELTQIQFAVSNEEMAKFAEIKALMAHKNYDGRWDVFFSQIADLALKQLQPKKRSEAKSKPESTPKSASEIQSAPETQSAPEGQATRHERGTRRHVSVKLKQDLKDKAGHQCEYVDQKTGRRCASKHALEIDHKIPLELGGPDELENMRVLCRAHNQYRAWALSGH